jgi:hypothetical protein
MLRRIAVSTMTPVSFAHRSLFIDSARSWPYWLVHMSAIQNKTIETRPQAIRRLIRPADANGRGGGSDESARHLTIVDNRKETRSAGDQETEQLCDVAR